MFSRYRVSALPVEKVLEMDEGIVAQQSLMSISCSLKNGQRGKVYIMWILSQLKNIYSMIPFI